MRKPSRRNVADVMVASGLSSIVASAWTAYGTSAGLGVTGLVLSIFGLLFVDVDAGRGPDDKPSA